ncbi:hypothetical protein [uncultured Ruegeria sp.]|uniref:hypothetical protein n=1 Tax=uncultured Ruegeria sp. TaxID=259304 RepID=UPI00262DF424|nr:hypothetical protein [uncultured Ruegeria sp.]
MTNRVAEQGPAVSVEVLFDDGTVLLTDEGLACRAAADAQHLFEEIDGSEPRLPYRDAAARLCQARRLAADGSLTVADRRRLLEHVTDTPVLTSPEVYQVISVEFVEPPDWQVVEALADDAWLDSAPSPLLTTTTTRTDDGAAVGCCAVRFADDTQREQAVRSIASDHRLSSSQRRAICERIARTPVVAS